MAFSPTDFGASFKGFLDQMSAAAPVEEPIFRRRLREHLECEPNELLALSENFPAHDHANVHAALEAEFSGAECSVTTFGVLNAHPYMSATLSMLAAPGKAGLMGDGVPTEGPVEYVNITLDDDRVVPCVQNGLFLVKRNGEPLAVLMAGPAKEFQPMAQVTIQVMALDRGVAEKFLAGVRTAMRKRNVYRGPCPVPRGNANGRHGDQVPQASRGSPREHHLAAGTAGTGRAPDGSFLGTIGEARRGRPAFETRHFAARAARHRQDVDRHVRRPRDSKSHRTCFSPVEARG